MSNNQFTEDDLSIVENIRTQLEGLKRTSDGTLLYSVIERGLTKYSGPKEKVEGAFLRFIHALLGRYADDPKGNPVTRVKARLAQQRLAFYVKPRSKGTKTTAEPSSKTESNDTADTRQKTKKAKVEIKSAKNSENSKPKIKHAKFESYTEESVQGPAEKKNLEPEPSLASNLVDSKDTNVDPIEQSLVENVTETVLRSQEFSALLKSNLKALKLAEKPDDLMDLKHLLVRGMEDLIKGHDDINQDLTAADSSIRQAQAEQTQLKQKLEKLSKHSVVDDLTGLPKREALRQQLLAEIGRAKRYGFSLVLSIIDIDNLKAINDKYGRGAGDGVLSYYAREVLSHFRTYDVVARYGGDEFAILFPNTQKEGAQRALEKAQKHASDTVFNHDGRSIPLPGFSSVVTVYSAGDRLDTLLSRANKALDMAKLRGDTGQSIVALPSN